MSVFSFIIISYNRAEDTIDAVKNVLALDDVDGWQKEIIVLNNGSTTDYSCFNDFIIELPQKQQSLINYIHHPKNLGVAGGRNLCIKSSNGQYLLFMDDDAEIVQTNVISFVLEKFHQYAAENLAIIGFMGKNPFTGITETPLKNPKLIENKKEVFYNLFFGYGHVFPKTLIDKTGFYQDDFFYGMEEYDLCYAAIKAGYSILFTQEILVLHKQNPDGREPNKTTYARMFSNKMVVVYKHLPMLYVCTHFMMWSLFLLKKSKFDLRLYFHTFSSIFKRLHNTPRQVMNKSGMHYLKKVGARLCY